MAAAAGRGRTRDKVGHTSVLWRGARVGILFLIIYTVASAIVLSRQLFVGVDLSGLGHLAHLS